MTLTIDEREITEHPDITNLLSIPIRTQRLEAGDYVFLSFYNDPVGIERCEINNFVQKLRDGELESQMRACAEQYSIVFILIEGVFDHVDGLLAIHKESDRGYYRNRIYPHTYLNTITASFISLIKMEIKIIQTVNFDCSMKMVQTIYQQYTKPDEARSLFRRIRPVSIPTKLSSNPAVPKLMALCPRLPEKVAVRLIYKFGDIWTILNTPEEQLLEIEGFGKTLLRHLKEGVGKE